MNATELGHSDKRCINVSGYRVDAVQIVITISRKTDIVYRMARVFIGSSYIMVYDFYDPHFRSYKRISEVLCYEEESYVVVFLIGGFVKSQYITTMNLSTCIYMFENSAR